MKYDSVDIRMRRWRLEIMHLENVENWWRRCYEGENILRRNIFTLHFMTRLVRLDVLGVSSLMEATWWLSTPTMLQIVIMLTPTNPYLTTMNVPVVNVVQPYCGCFGMARLHHFIFFYQNRSAHHHVHISQYLSYSCINHYLNKVLVWSKSSYVTMQPRR